MFVQPRHLPQGLDRGDPPQHPVGDRPRCRRSTTTSGSCTRPTTGRRRTTSPREQPEKLARAAAAVPDRGGQVQRAAARRPPRRALQPRPRRPARSSIRGNSQLLFGGMGRLTENSVARASRTSRTRSRRRSTCPRAARDGVIVAQGGAFGGWSLYLHEGRPAYCYNLFGLQRFKVYGDAAGPAPASTRSGWSSPTTAAGSARAATATLYVDGDAGRRGAGRAHRADALLGRRDHRRRQRQRHARQRRLRPAGQRVHRARPLGPDRHRRGRRGPRPPDHPRGALRVAMARQ